MTAPPPPVVAAPPSPPSTSPTSPTSPTSSASAAADPALQQPDLRRFLRPTGDSETRYIRMLSSLCAQTYYIERLTSRSLWRRHRLELVSTSRACELRGARGGPLAQQRASPSGFSSAGYSSGSPGSSAPPSPGRGALLLPSQEREEREAFEDALGDSDAMAASPAQAAAAAAAADAAASLASAGAPPTDALAAAALARVQAADAPAAAAEVVAAEEAAALVASGSVPAAPLPRQSATDLVASRLAAAAQAAAAAAAPLASAAGSAVGSAASAAASNVGSLAAAAGAAAPEPLRAVAGAAAAGAAGVAGNLPLRAVAGSLQSAAAAGHSTAVATIALVTAAVQSTWGSSGEASKVSGSGLDGSDPDGDGGACAASPTEWFVADDPGSHTRYFVIQGSDTLDHWKVNLTFEPVPFEDPDLGVKVHRGVYEAALRLYGRFLPLVVEHVASSPFAKVVFAGHSLGGSLGTLLMLMFLRRGVLPPVALSPAYTFGAPAVLCDAAAWGAAPSGAGPPGAPAPPSPLASSPTLARTPLSADPASRPRGCSVCGAPAGDCLHVATGPCAAPLLGSSAGGGFRPPAPLLERLCLPPGAVRNVLMARDIVPRAFTCDYSSVAGVLWAAGSAFRGLECLHTPASAAAAEEEAAVAAAAGRSVLAAAVERASAKEGNGGGGGGGSSSTSTASSSSSSSSSRGAPNSLFSSSSTRQVMYTFVGRLVVLQPDAAHAFVKGEREAAGHPLLPPGPGLYTLREPALLPGAGASGANNIAPLVRGGGKRVVVGSGASSPPSGAKATPPSWSASPATPPPKYAPARLRPVRSVSAAVAALMDQPHPLEMLADKASYGDDGAISRYHNPDHYTQAVGGVLRARAGSSRWRPLAELAEIGRGEPGRQRRQEAEGGGASSCSSSAAAASASASAPAPAAPPSPDPPVPPPSPFLARLSPATRPQLGRGGGTTVIRARPAEKDEKADDAEI